MFRSFIILILGLFSIMHSVNAASMGQEVQYKQGDVMLKGYLAYDDKIEGKRPGILVVHEWWGHNDYARKRADMLAGMGYTALAVDMYGKGIQASHPKDAGRFAKAVAGNLELAKARFIAALEFLNKQPSVDPDRNAAIGYCFGGGIVLQMARAGLDLKAVASFHGSLGSENPAQKGAVKADMLVFNGAADPFVKPEHVTGFVEEMREAEAKYILVSYPGVKHSFSNPGANKFGEKFKLPLQYDEHADKDSWAIMESYFERLLK